APVSQMHALEKELAALSIQRDALEQDLTQTDNDSTSKEGEQGEFTRRMTDLQQKLSNQQELFDEMLPRQERLQLKIQTAEGKIAQCKTKLQVGERVLDAKQNEYNLTKSMIDNLDGFPESIHFLKKHAGWKKTPPLLSDILFCQQDYRIAIENY